MKISDSYKNTMAVVFGVVAMCIVALVVFNMVPAISGTNGHWTLGQWSYWHKEIIAFGMPRAILVDYSIATIGIIASVIGIVRSVVEFVKG